MNEQILSDKRSKLKELWKNSNNEIKNNVSTEIEAPITPWQASLLNQQFKTQCNYLYNMPIVYSICGELDILKLKAALQKLYANTAILQIVLKNHQNQLHMVLKKHDHVNTFYEDFSNINEAIKFKLFQSKVIKLNNEPYDLYEGPLLRFGIFYFNKTQTFLLLSMHHILFDGTSLPQIMQNLMNHYYGIEEIHLTSMDYLAYAKAQLYSSITEADYIFWQNQFKNTKPLQLPVINSDKSISSRYFHSIKLSKEININLVQKVKNKASELQATDFTIYLSVLYLLLRDMVKQKDFPIQISMSSRNSTRCNQTIGYFINSMPICLYNMPEQYNDLVYAISQKILGLIDSQAKPFEQIVQTIANTQEDNGLNVMMIYQDLSISDSNFEIKFVDIDNHITPINLLLNIYKTGTTYHLSMTGSSVLFKKNQLEILFDNYINSLTAILEQPDKIILDYNNAILPIGLIISLYSHTNNTLISNTFDFWLRQQFDLPINIRKNNSLTVVDDADIEFYYVTRKNIEDEQSLYLLLSTLNKRAIELSTQIYVILNMIQEKSFIGDNEVNVDLNVLNNIFPDIDLYQVEQNNKTIKKQIIEYISYISRNIFSQSIIEIPILVIDAELLNYNEFIDKLQIILDKVQKIIILTQNEEKQEIKNKLSLLVNKNYYLVNLNEFQENNSMSLYICQEADETFCWSFNLISIPVQYENNFDCWLFNNSKIKLNEKQLGFLKWQNLSIKKYHSIGEFNNIYLNSDKLLALIEPTKVKKLNNIMPITNTEVKLYHFWKKIFDNQEFDCETNFFYLGGSSVQAMLCVNQIQSEFNRKINLIDFFIRPTIKEFSNFLDNNHKALLHRIVKIDRSSRNNQFPVSVTQKRIYMLMQLEPSNIAYNMPFVIKLTGELFPDKLEIAFKNIIKKHEALRTYFYHNETEVFQAFVEEIKFDLIIHDYTHFESGSMKEKLDMLIMQMVQQIFDLNKVPLFNLQLVKVKENSYYLLFNIHHIIFDGWSLQNLFSELSYYYNNDIQTNAISSALTLQPIDYCIWEKNFLKEATVYIEYWQKKLHGYEYLDILTDKTRPYQQKYNGNEVQFTMQGDDVAYLVDFAKKNNVSLFVVLLAAWYVVIYFYSNQRDICIGVPIANRQDRASEEIIGYLINILVLRTEISLNDSFAELVSKINTDYLASLEYSQLPFAKLMEILRFPADLSRHPLVQVMFNYINLEKPSLKLRELTGEIINIKRNYTKFDLNFYLEHTETTLVGLLEYDAELYYSDTPLQMLEHFKLLLRAITNPSFIHLKDYTDLSISKELSLVNQPNNVLDLIKKNVLEYSNKAAVIDREKQYTYSDIDALSDKIAYKLSQNFAAGMHIALFVPHTGETIIAILACLKAGLCYVPIDVSLPEARIAKIITSSDSVAVLTLKQYAHTEMLSRQLIPVFQLDSDFANQANQSQYRYNPAAYILYTSGTTGQPKGVKQTQAAIIQHITNYISSVGLKHTDNVLQLASYGFDAAVMDIFAALFAGSTLVMVDLKQTSPREIITAINKNEITIFHSTPSVFRIIADELNESEYLNSLRYVVLGGEPVKAGDFFRYRNKTSANCSFINGLGPSESTLVLQLKINKDYVPIYSTIPVGKPVAGTHILLHDSQGNRMPVLGELTIESAAVAPGYYKLPELTEKKFTALENNHYRYHTGDLCRLLPNQQYYFIGRKDNQIKIRGYRVELEEVEQQILYIKDVNEAAVCFDTNTERLYAFVKFIANAATSLEDLKTHLQKNLPNYMCPYKFYRVDELPKNVNGKIDKTALLQDLLKMNLPIQDNPNVMSSIEQELVNIWRQLLPDMPFTVETNFFDAGGNSILVLSLHSFLIKNFAVTCSLMDIYQNPTIKLLAQLIEQADAKPTAMNNNILKRDQLAKRRKYQSELKNRRQHELN